MSSSNATSLGATRLGWVQSPDGRGTLDIVWSCVSTLFICLWSMLHLNVPSKRDTFWTIFWRKARWLVLGVLAPEVPMLFACGQWASAKRSLQDMKQLGYSDSEWSIAHAYYADSGGFELQMPCDGQTIPITAKQVHYLVQNRFISLPRTTKKEIWDKSNADKAAKFLACFQTAWLTIQTVGRPIERLSVTPLELSSVSLALTSLTTLWFWAHKPLDVETATVVYTESSLEDIIASREDVSSTDYINTPLDFIEPRAYIARKWAPTMLSKIIRWGLQTHPIERIPNDRDPQLSNVYQHIALGVATASFASIHFAAWNFSFETEWERWLWRGNCILMWVLLATYGTAEVIACCREDFQNLGMDTMGGYKLRWPACLWFVVPASLYAVTRFCLIFEVWYSMRSLPPDAFIQVQWSAIIPHW